MNNQVLYKYSKMDLEQFALFEENVSPIIKEVQFQTEVQFSYDKNSRILCSKIVATMILKEKPLLKADFRSYFEIAPESIEDLRQERNIIFPPQVLVQFASLCYGSLRGVIHVKTLGTALNSFILPPVFFGNLIDKAFSVEG